MTRAALFASILLFAWHAIESHATPFSLAIQESSSEDDESIWDLRIEVSNNFDGDSGARSGRGSSATSSIGDADAPTFAFSRTSSFTSCKQRTPPEGEPSLRGICVASGSSNTSLEYRVGIDPREGVDPAAIFAISPSISVSIDYVLEAIATNNGNSNSFSSSIIRFGSTGDALFTNRLPSTETLRKSGTFESSFSPFGGSFGVLLRTQAMSTSGPASTIGVDASGGASALADPVFRIDPAFADLFDITSTLVPELTIEESVQDPVASVPEPSLVSLLGLGLLGMGVIRGRVQKRR